MKKLLVLLCLVLGLLILTAAAYAQTTTIMMYMCGSNIYEDCETDLGEITGAVSGNNVTFSVLAGGAKKWNDKRLTSGALNLFTIQNGAWSSVTNWGKANMGDIATLKKFVNHSMDQYPADRYILVLWDHGGGSSSGICFDEVHNDDALTVVEIEQALSDLSKQRSGFHLDIFGSDACLMATYEMAAVVKDYADYYIASEELEPWLGWYYTNWVSALSSQPDMSSRDLAIAVVDSYRAGCEKEDPNDYLTLSAIDLSRMDELVTCMDSLATVLASQISKDVSTMSRTLQSLYSFGSFDDAGSDCVDLTAFLTACSSYDSALVSRTQSVLKEVILYNYRTSLVPSAEGMSIFVPMENASSYSALRSAYEANAVKGYAVFVKAFANAVSGSGFTFSSSSSSPSQMSGDDFCSSDFITSAYDYSYGDCWSDWDWDESEWGWCDEDDTWWTYGYGGDYGCGYDYGSGFGYNGSECGYDSTSSASVTQAVQSATSYISGSAVDNGFVIAGAQPAATSAPSQSGNIFTIAGTTQAPAATSAPALPGEFVIAGSMPAPVTTAKPDQIFVVAGQSSAGAAEGSGTAPINVTVPEVITSGVGFSMSLTDDEMNNLAYAEAILLCDWSNEEGYDMEVMGIVRDTWVDWKNNKVYSLFDGTWPTINGLFVVMFDQSKTERVRRSLVPVMLNDSQFTYLVVVFRDGSKEGQIIGYSDGWSADGLPVRGTTDLKEGDVFTPVYTSYYCDADETPSLDTMTSQRIWYTQDDFRITWDGTQTVTYENLADAEAESNYKLAFRLHDIYGGKTDTGMVSVTLQ